MIQWIWETSVDDSAKREIQPTLDRLTQRVADREYSEAVEKLVSELLGMPTSEIKDDDVVGMDDQTFKGAW